MESTIDWITKKLSQGKQNRSHSGLTFYESAIGCMGVAIENAYMAGLEDQANAFECIAIWRHSHDAIIKALVECSFSDEGITSALLSFGVTVQPKKIQQIIDDEKLIAAKLTEEQINTLYLRAQLYMRHVLRSTQPPR